MEEQAERFEEQLKASPDDIEALEVWLPIGLRLQRNA